MNGAKIKNFGDKVPLQNAQQRQVKLTQMR
jgi:hypothetical protein